MGGGPGSCPICAPHRPMIPNFSGMTELCGRIRGLPGGSRGLLGSPWGSWWAPGGFLEGSRGARRARAPAWAQGSGPAAPGSGPRRPAPIQVSTLIFRSLISIKNSSPDPRARKHARIFSCIPPLPNQGKYSVHIRAAFGHAFGDIFGHISGT